jgi:hypothetical protein
LRELNGDGTDAEAATRSNWRASGNTEQEIKFFWLAALLLAA